MQRAAIEKQSTIHRWRSHLARHKGEVLCKCEFQAGRFRKGQRVGGCGRPRCFLCHGDKLLGVATVADRKADQREREGFADL